jgi:sugar lactone lactonase YvrE
MASLRATVFTFVVLFGGAFSVSAQVSQIYTANEWQNSLEQVNMITGQITTLYTTTPAPDDIIVNSAGQILYSVPSPGTVNLWDPTTGVNMVLADNIPAARDLEIEPGGATMLIAKCNSPAEIIRYTFSTGTWTVLVPESTFGSGGSANGITYDAYGNLYAVVNRNTITQIDPKTGDVLATLVTEPYNGANGSDGLTYDSYTNSLWSTHAGKTLGGGLIQVPVQPSGFVSTSSSGFTFYPTPTVGAPDGIKSDGIGNLYVGAIHTALVYSIPTHAITYNVVTDGADGVALVPGSGIFPPPQHPPNLHIGSDR